MTQESRQSVSQYQDAHRISRRLFRSPQRI
jgi:hypothetical protein